MGLWAVGAHSEVVTPIEALRAIGSINAKRGLVAQSENPFKKRRGYINFGLCDYSRSTW